ncbi:MAG: hypothetical protein A2138_21245 [Deltaproteobacteria bacterium RBG_16_71_12]|nr:MAG: hypothetical protein A2138_21245 [Deltaproteobacteria bacterium RBG_16_71_12]
MTDLEVTPEAYARWRATTLGAITERVEVRAVFDLAGPLEGRRVLDVGTGDGSYALEAAARGASATGLDAERAMLDAARARSSARGVSVRLEQGRAEALPFDDGSFDVVLAVTVLCFVPDAARAVAEMARVLTPDGRVVLGELSRMSVWAAERRLRGWLGAGAWRRARFWSRSELAALLGAAGLHVVDARSAVYFPPIAALGRAAEPLESVLARVHAPGAAFLAVAAARRGGHALDHLDLGPPADGVTGSSAGGRPRRARKDAS